MWNEQPGGAGSMPISTQQERIGGFFLRVVERGASIAESYWVNTKLFPQLMVPDLEEDAVARANARAVARATAVVEETVVSGGKKYLTFPTVPLPAPVLPEAKALKGALERRRSVREFDVARPLALEEVSTLLHFSYGWNPHRVGDYPRKHVPSAGGLFPLEIYLACLDVTGLKKGTIYHYRPTQHVLEELGSSGERKPSSLFDFTDWVDSCGLLIFLTGVLPRLSWKYGERALRYLLLDAGHAAQNICLVGSALDLGVCPLVSVFDDRVHDLLDVDGLSEFAVYAVAIGWPLQAKEVG